MERKAFDRRHFLLTASAGAAALVSGCARSRSRVVLYVSHDWEHTGAILQRFSQRTGMVVDVRTDTEASKSVGLYELIVREKDRPRCDVFWNGEMLHTIRLAEQGLLAAYEPPGAQGLPSWCRAADGTWYGLAARARVLLVHREAGDSVPRTLADLVDRRWQGRVAVARPQFGSTATHMACLHAAWGRERWLEWMRRLSRHAVTVPGNRQVAEAAARGECLVGLTDTDDAALELRRGSPARVVFPDQDKGQDGTLVFPNTLALLAGAPHPDAARQLLDHLVSPETERTMARAPGAHIPLHRDAQDARPSLWPAHIEPLAVDFQRAARLWEETQSLLRAEWP